MKLNRRVQVLIIPVLTISFMLVAIGMYLVERGSIYQQGQKTAELEATELAASFNQYGLMARGILASLVESDSLRSFLSSTDKQLQALAMSSGLDGVLNILSDYSTGFFSIAFFQGDGRLEYYYENSLDPFSEPDPVLGKWAEAMARQKVGFGSIYLQESQRIAYCRILDRTTLKAPLEFGTASSLMVVTTLSPVEFIQRSRELAEVGRTVAFWATGAAAPSAEKFEARRELNGFGALSVQLDRTQVEQNLERVVIWLVMGFGVLAALTYGVLRLLLGRYVIGPINRLESQLGQVDLEATQEIDVLRSNDEIGNLSRSFARLYAKLRETYEGTRELAERDTLTSLYNRRVFNQTLERLLTRAGRSGQGVALLYIDIDNFKLVNDHYGHSVGDQLLRDFATRLHDVVRGSDLVFGRGEMTTTMARLAGDEFAVILHGGVEGEVAGRVARRILDICANGFSSGAGRFPVSLSIGVALYPQDAANLDELIRHADSAMYHSKKHGKNTISFYSEQQGEAAKRQQQLELHLKQLDTSEFSVKYMPIVSATDHRVYGFEALLRWYSGALGSVSPAEFIPVAESLGMYEEIDLWVIDRVFADSPRFVERFGHDIRVSVNISAAELSREDFVDKVLQLVDRHGVNPAMFTVEITETFYQDHSASSGALFLQRLSEAGFRLAIDDLGSGYSSLVQLVEFPITMVKLDRQLILKSLQAANDRLLRSLVEFCHVQELLITAEGVEDEETGRMLAGVGCDFLQGYGYSPPLSLDKALVLPVVLPAENRQ